MSSRRQKQVGRKDSHGRRDYVVGRGRPPKATQFKPGQSGNPKGRPKGAKNESTIVRGLLNRKIAIREGGKTRKVSVLEAIFIRFAEDALKGNPKSAAFLLNRYGLAEGTDAPEASGLDQDDQQILESFRRHVESQLNTKKDKP
jgi:hypothetical protein